MAEQRRPLTEGIAIATPVPQPTTHEIARGVAFLEAGASSTGPKAMRSAASAAAGMSLNTRLHPDLCNALKRASLQRKLDGVEPNSLRDILEEAVTPWLRDKGYLP